MCYTVQNGTDMAKNKQSTSRDARGLRQIGAPELTQLCEGGNGSGGRSSVLAGKPAVGGSKTRTSPFKQPHDVRLRQGIEMQIEANNRR